MIEVSLKNNSTYSLCFGYIIGSLCLKDKKGKQGPEKHGQTKKPFVSASFCPEKSEGKNVEGFSN